VRQRSWSRRSAPRWRRRSPSRADTTTPVDAALEQALRALRHRDRTATEIDRFLESRGVAESERREVVETLLRTALVDDRRYAESRASALAERGAGNDRIRHELAFAGVADDVTESVLESLAGERERAQAIVERRGATAKTARYLAGKGFPDDVVHAVVAHARDEALG
jgi:regulatory protein